MEVLSHLTTGINGGESMAATNTVSQVPDFGAPGSRSESTADVTRGTPGPDLPQQANAHEAGNGDRGGVLPAEGTAPGAGWGWVNVNDFDDPADVWKGGNPPVRPMEAGH